MKRHLSRLEEASFRRPAIYSRDPYEEKLDPADKPRDDVVLSALKDVVSGALEDVVLSVLEDDLNSI